MQMCFFSSNLRELVFDVNEYVDKLFAEIDAYIIQAGLDPADLEDIHEEFDYVSSTYFLSFKTFYRAIKLNILLKLCFRSVQTVFI